MAMLAQPRQRKRYNLVPKGKALYEDENCFGSKMLKKMGWEKGQGLGAKHSGSKDFVRIRYKNDSFGLGFEERDDQWTTHEQSFSGLLDTLNNGETSRDKGREKENSVENEESVQPRCGLGFHDANVIEVGKTKVDKMKEKISGVSLEERSKQSKVRVHYKKFTKSKDITQYSEKDLANIFGKKAVDEQQDINTFFQNLNNTLSPNQQNSEGVQIINTGVSVNDYFKTKIKAHKKRENLLGNKDEILESNEERFEKNCIQSMKNVINDADDIKHENAGDKKEECKLEVIDRSVEVKDTTKKKKIKKVIENLDNGNVPCLVEKKSKKRKRNDDREKVTYIEIERKVDNIKKSKKSEEPDIVNILEPSLDDTKNNKDSTNENTATKKKISNNSQAQISELSGESERDVVIDLTQKPTKRKHKKNKTPESNEIIELDDSVKDVAENYVNEYSIKSKKNKTKRKESINSHNTNPPPTPVKTKKSNVKIILPSDVKMEALDLEEIKKMYQVLNNYPISSFCAEKFRHVNFDKFVGSTVSQINGYGYDSNLQLEIQNNKKDEVRIINLWKGVLNKYDQMENKSKSYRQYVKKVIKSRKTQVKPPKLYVKTWKRKNAFQLL